MMTKISRNLARILALMLLLPSTALLAQKPAPAQLTVDAATIVELLHTLTLLLVPFAPFLAAELWKDLGETSDVFLEPWPVADAELARESEIEIPVQVNGKLVVVIKLAADADEEAIKVAAMGDEKVISRLEGKTVVKTIVIKGKMINVVVR